MGIMTRFTRLCRADIHGVMDQIEDKGLMLKQCLREMEESLARKQAELNKVKAAFDQTRHDREQFCREQEKLEGDLNAAIEKEKDDIARLLIKKLKTIDQHLDAMTRHGNTLERKIASLNEQINTQKHQHAELQLRAETYFQQSEHKRWEDTVSKIIPRSTCSDLSDDEVELELINRKEAMKGGA
jgi:phage shock protein A